MQRLPARMRRLPRAAPSRPAGSATIAMVPPARSDAGPFCARIMYVYGISSGSRPWRHVMAHWFPVRRRPKLTRDLFKRYFHKFWAEGSKAAAVCGGPGPLCFVVIHAKDATQVVFAKSMQCACEARRRSCKRLTRVCA